MIFILAYIIDVCNYNCAYCYNEKPRTNKVLDLNRLYAFLEYLQKRTKKNIDIELIGGEPTLHPNLIDFCQKLCSLPKTHCSIYSNFSSNTSLYIQLLELGVGFTLSSHGQHEDFAAKLDEIPFHYYKKNNINIRIMFEFNEYCNVKTLCEKLLIKYKDYFEPAIIQSNCSVYSSKYIDFYNCIDKEVRQKYVYTVVDANKKHKLLTVNMAEQHFKNFKYWLCNAGLEYFYIHADGNIYSCINQYEHRQMPLCNINSNFNNIQLKPMICMYDICPCIWEVYKKKILNI